MDLLAARLLEAARAEDKFGHIPKLNYVNSSSQFEDGSLGQKQAMSKGTQISQDSWPEIDQSYNELVSLHRDFRKLLCSTMAEEERDHVRPGALKFLLPDGIEQAAQAGRSYFFTEQGRVGRGCPGDRVGDILIRTICPPM